MMLKVINLSRKNNNRWEVRQSVFIGHGRSPIWREVKEFIFEHLQLPYEEFNRVPTAGMTIIEEPVIYFHRVLRIFNMALYFFVTK